MKGYMILIFIGGVFAFLGTVFRIISFFVSRSSNRLKNICKGKVLGVFNGIYENHSWGGSEGSGITYYPKYNYSVNGVDYDMVSSVGYSRERMVSRDNVTICYNISNPKEAYVETNNKDINLVVRIFSIVGWVMIVVGLVLVVVGLVII